MKLVLLGCVLALSMPVSADTSSPMLVSPAQRQSPKQLETDSTDCREIAKNKSGFDPGVSSPSQGQDQQNVAKGAVGGSALGAAMGHTPRGAAIGAVRAKRNNQKNSEHQATEQAQYNEAESSCLKSRGYNVAQK